ncbi:hypothetical protein Hanom_Chr01g00074451 [Helianthus anomalus]
MNLAPHSNFNLSLSFIFAIISLLLKCIALMIEPVNLHIQFFVPISLFQHRCFMEALFQTLTFDLGFAGYFRFLFFFERAVGSSSALFLKSEVQKVEYFFMINEEVNGNYENLFFSNFIFVLSVY